jgi:ferritin-like metal-binding protein YciE
MLTEKLVGHLQEAHAMETEITQVLHQQIALMDAHPEVQAKLTQHLAETELQRKRMAQRLAAYEHNPSMIKGAASMVLGNVVGLRGAMRGDLLSANLQDDYVTEHMEIATYTRLIAVARACGDEETVKVAQLSLNEEIAMAEWLFARLPIAAYADLQAQGEEIPQDMLADARVGPSMRVTFDPLKDVQEARHASHQQE